MSKPIRVGGVALMGGTVFFSLMAVAMVVLLWIGYVALVDFIVDVCKKVDKTYGKLKLVVETVVQTSEAIKTSVNNAGTALLNKTTEETINNFRASVMDTLSKIVNSAQALKALAEPIAGIPVVGRAASAALKELQPLVGFIEDAFAQLETISVQLQPIQSAVGAVKEFVGNALGAAKTFHDSAQKVKDKIDATKTSIPRVAAAVGVAMSTLLIWLLISQVWVFPAGLRYFRT